MLSSNSGAATRGGEGGGRPPLAFKEGEGGGREEGRFWAQRAQKHEKKQISNVFFCEFLKFKRLLKFLSK